MPSLKLVKNVIPPSKSSIKLTKSLRSKEKSRRDLDDCDDVEVSKEGKVWNKDSYGHSVSTKPAKDYEVYKIVDKETDLVKVLVVTTLEQREVYKVITSPEKADNHLSYVLKVYKKKNLVDCKTIYGSVTLYDSKEDLGKVLVDPVIKIQETFEETKLDRKKKFLSDLYKYAPLVMEDVKIITKVKGDIVSCSLESFALREGKTHVIEFSASEGTVNYIYNGKLKDTKYSVKDYLL